MALDTTSHQFVEGFVLYVTATGVTRPYLVFDVSASNGGVNTFGAAQFLFQPDLDSTHTVGVFCAPVINFGHTPYTFLAAYTMTLGTLQQPIPQGTPGQFCGYEANLFTNQKDIDLQSLVEHGHAFGATLNVYTGKATIKDVQQGNQIPGAWYDILDGVIHINTNATEGTPKGANCYGIAITIDNNVSDGTHVQFGAEFESSGTVTSYAGMQFVGLWTHGVILNGHTLEKVTYITFSSAGDFMANKFPAPFDYRIDGSAPDILRIMGGGTYGGIVFDGGPNAWTGSGPNYYMLFRHDPSALTAFNLDTHTGNGYFAGCVSTPSSCTPSDEMLKKNVTDYTEGIAEFKALPRLKEFEYNGLAGYEDGMKGIGFMAQELQAVRPDWISPFQMLLTTQDKTPTAVLHTNNQRALMLMFNALQELIAKLGM